MIFRLQGLDHASRMHLMTGTLSLLEEQTKHAGLWQVKPSEEAEGEPAVKEELIAGCTAFGKSLIMR